MRSACVAQFFQVVSSKGKSVGKAQIREGGEEASFPPVPVGCGPASGGSTPMQEECPKVLRSQKTDGRRWVRRGAECLG